MVERGEARESVRGDQESSQSGRNSSEVRDLVVVPNRRARRQNGLRRKGGEGERISSLTS